MRAFFDLTSHDVTIHRTWLHNRTATARACAGGAAEAVIARHDFAIVDLVWIDVPQKNGACVLPLHVELLIKIAIVNLAAPSDAKRVAAH